MLELALEYFLFLMSWYCWKWYILPFMGGWYLIHLSDILFSYMLGAKKIMKKNLLFILGSGGHTGELLQLLQNFDFKKYKCLYFVRSSSDRNSEIRMRKLLEEKKIAIENTFWIAIPRSRNVKQSYFTSIFTSVWSIIVTFFKLYRYRDADGISMILFIFLI